MSLPSRYAPGGITDNDSKRPVTIGKYKKKPIEYVVKTIEDKVDSAVRSSRYSEDIEMVPIDDYNEALLISDYVSDSRSSNRIDYDSMDVDGEFADMIEEPNASYLVVDTNFALSHLKILDEIRCVAEKYRVKIVIPLTVMRELDGLKQSSKAVNTSSSADSALKGKTIGHLARWANDWIFNQLSNINSPVKGQKIKQRVDRTTSKDDSILDCCIYFQENFRSSLVVLLSDDKNLCLKALANDVLTVSFKPDMDGQLISETIYQESVARYGTYSEPVLIEKEPKRTTSNPQDDTMDFKTASRTIYSEVYALTKSAVHHAMVSAYEEDLDLIQNYNKDHIHDLSDIDKVIRQFWISVFTDFLYKIDYKSGFILCPPHDNDELATFISEWSAVLVSIYDKLLSTEQQQALNLLIERWRTMLSSLT